MRGRRMLLGWLVFLLSQAAGGGSDPAAQGVLVNVAPEGTARQSTTAAPLPGAPEPHAARATSGHTLGYWPVDPREYSDQAQSTTGATFGDEGAGRRVQALASHYPIALTLPEASPWWEIDLGAEREVAVVEVWLPRNVGQTYVYHPPPPGGGSSKAKERGGGARERREQRYRERGERAGRRRSRWSRRELLAAGGGEGGGVGELMAELLGAEQGDGPLALAGGVVGRLGGRPGEFMVELRLPSPRAARRVRVSASPGAASSFRAALALAEVRVLAQVPWDSEGCGKWCRHGRCDCGGGGCVCACDPDWVGAACDTPLLSAWEHLPPEDVAGGPGAEAGAAWYGARDSREAQRGLRGTQYPRRCPDRARHYPDLMQSGMGSTLLLMTAALSDAHMDGRMFLPPDRWRYASDEAFCGRRGGFDCYFQPWSRTPVEEENRVWDGRCNDGERACSGMSETPPQFAPRGVFWWRMHAMAFLARTSRRAAQELRMREAKERIGYEHPIIGLHVRRGDSCFLARAGHCLGLRDYVPALELLRARYGVSRVFLATDDRQVVADANAHRGPLRFVLMPVDRSMFEVTKPARGSGWKMSIEKRLKNNEVSAHKVAASSLMDVSLLAEADYLVGTASASFFKLALLLSAYHKQRVPPYVSLDGAWCYHWRMCCSVLPNGTSTVC